MGTATSVFIRGSASNQVLVMIDGVEINSTTTGAYDFANLTTESIERIEVLRGAGGTLYGSQAIGGVINIITKRGQGPLDVGVSAQGGNGWTNRQVATLRGGVGKLGYAFSVGHIGSQGFQERQRRLSQPLDVGAAGLSTDRECQPQGYLPLHQYAMWACSITTTSPPQPTPTLARPRLNTWANLSGNKNPGELGLPNFRIHFQRA